MSVIRFYNKKRKHEKGKLLVLAGILCMAVLFENIRSAGGYRAWREHTIDVMAFSADAGEEEQMLKKVAITFDDGPNADYTQMLLDGLKERGVKATFFLLGKETDRCSAAGSVTWINDAPESSVKAARSGSSILSSLFLEQSI